MGYTTKWIFENLGITIDMIRHYEKEKLMPIEGTRNPTNNYRDYSEQDVERIWAIKLLIGIGFTAKEIRALMADPNFDFDSAINQKVIELEEAHDKNVIYLQFAKTIQLTGKVPTTSRIGGMRFDDFMKYAHDNWNFCDDPKVAPFMKGVELIASGKTKELSVDDINQILKVYDVEYIEKTMYAMGLHGYYQVISSMKEFGHENDIVQRVVGLLHEYMVKNNYIQELEGKITPEYIAKYTAPLFFAGSLSAMYEQNYGKEGCLFIARALAYYGGYEIED